MQEFKLRLWHRRMGATFAVFLLVQGLTGAVLALGWITELPAWAYDLSARLHLGGVSDVWSLYRIVIGVGDCLMAATGLTIWWMVRKRLAKQAAAVKAKKP